MLDLLERFGFGCINARGKNMHVALGYESAAQLAAYKHPNSSSYGALQCGYRCACAAASRLEHMSSRS